MSITADLEQILSARYGKDVRQSIHDAIEEGYNIAVQAQGTAETSQESAEAYAAAALASEQAAQGYMELAEQYKNEAFSGTPTGYADLVAKVNSIYKETADSFSLADTVEGLALAHTIYGMSEQDGTPTPSVPVDIDSAVANFTCTDSDSSNTKTITTGLTLRAIEVTSSDDYNLVKAGKYYITDTLDWDEDNGYSITRRIGTTTITESTNGFYYASDSNGGYQCSPANFANVHDIKYPSANNVKVAMMSDSFVTRSNDDNNNINNDGGLAMGSTGWFRLVNRTLTTSEAWRTWLTSNPVELIFVTNTPTTETVTSAQAQALLGLKTYDEATSIDATGDVAPSVTLEYSKDRNTALALIGHNMAHINALKIADLSA